LNVNDRWSLSTIALIVLAALVLVVVFATHPPDLLLASPFGERGAPKPAVSALPSAFGASGEVRLQLRLPGEPFEFPVEVQGDRETLEYQWVSAADSAAMFPSEKFSSATVRAPLLPGFYRLAIAHPDTRTIVDSIVVGVMVPFSAKVGSTLNGYQIGRYNFERSPGDGTPPPPGFVEVREDNQELAVSTHFRLGDFLTHDDQERWPRYLALDPRILDKVELVLRYLGSRDHDMSVNVNSGYRTPLHNRRVPRAASDSRHQYGDAADLAIDVDQNGKVSYFDVLAVARAVELVERDHPELVGGLGIYGNHGTSPYVHIDVRGQRKRWRG
jgi:uncharacterized protein YcbK (DUF882 family)